MPESYRSPTTTVVFTDIEGHTSMMQRLGDARGRQFLRDHERIVRAALRRHSGNEVKTMGDGFMVSFGSAHAALVCAIDLQRQFDAYNAAAVEPLHVRVGINAGEPIAEGADLFGQSVISASRIAGLASGGEILVSLVVHELVAGKGFLFADRGLHNLRGMDDPMRVFELYWRADEAVPVEYRQDAEGVSGARPSWRRPGRVLVAAGSVIAVGGVVAALLFLFKDSDSPGALPGDELGSAHDATRTAATDVAGASTAGAPVPVGRLGDVAYVSKTDEVASIWIAHFDGTGRRAVAAVPTYDSGLALSPDGERFAFTSRVDGVRQIYLVNPDGSGLIALTGPPFENNEAVWSPDGTRIAFTSNRDGNKDVYLMNGDGSDVVQITTDPADDFHPAWSPDGSRIVFASHRAGNREVFTMAADGSDVVRLTQSPGNDDQPAWSPDGTRIAFTSVRDGNREIYTVAADGSLPLRLTDDPADDFHPAWSPDGQRLSFTSNRDTDANEEIYLIRPDGSGLTRLTNNPGEEDYAIWFPALR